jgi:hypothetical protein
MAIITLNNNSLSSVTALPAAIATGKVLQVVTATDSANRSTTSASFVTASNTLSVTITPSSASNKILIMVDTGAYNTGTGDYYLTIYRDATNIGTGNGMLYIGGVSNLVAGCNMHNLDSPSTTSAITYQVYIKISSGTAFLNFNGGKGSITAYEIAG